MKAIRLGIIAALTTSSAQAALTISDKPTNNVICDGGICTATAKQAVLNVTDLANLIALSPVTIQSGSEAQDIVVDAPFSWTDSNALKLDANHSISVNKPVSDSGPARLELKTKRGDLFFGKNGSFTFLNTSNPLVVNGQKYKLIDTLPRLASAVG